MYMVDTYGFDYVKTLQGLSKTISKIPTSDLIELIEIYKKKLAKLDNKE